MLIFGGQEGCAFSRQARLLISSRMATFNPMQMVSVKPTDKAAAIAAEHRREPAEGKQMLDSASIVGGLNSPRADNGDSASDLKRKTCSDDRVSSSQMLLWKTSLCSFFRRSNGHCKHGHACQYAHGDAELRLRPDQSWDPTSDRAKKLSKSSEGEKIELSSEAGTRMSSPPMKEEDSALVVLDKCLIHLPRRWTSDNLKSFLDGQGLLYKSAKKKKGMTVAFISFESTEQVKTAVEELDGKSFGNKHLKVADALPQSFLKKPTPSMFSSSAFGQITDGAYDDPGGDNENNMVEKENCTTKESGLRSARDAVTPLAHMCYSDQLKHKQTLISKTLKKLTHNVRRACPKDAPLPEWILASREIGGLPCNLEGILESPCIYGYRNKCEFSIGYSLEGKRTVGFMLGNFREGMTAIEPPINCPNVSRVAYKYVEIFQVFLQSSDFPAWNNVDNTGFWRQLTVREGRSPCQRLAAVDGENHIAEIMLIVQVCLADVADEAIKSEFKRMAHALADGAVACSPPLPLSVLVIQDYRGTSGPAPAGCPLIVQPIPDIEHVSSSMLTCDPVEPRIHDYICNLRFSISPTAFFQVNTLAAERLYALAGDWANPSPDTLLFDICCGTGAVGLSLASRVGMVVGIEMNESAVSDAKRNAEINGINNCIFICAKAENVIGTVLHQYIGGSHVGEKAGNEDVTMTASETSIGGGFGHNGMSSIPTMEGQEPEPAGSVEMDCIGDDHLYHLSLSEGAEHEPHEFCTTSKDEARESSHDLHKRKDVSVNTKISGTSLQNFKDVVAVVDPPRAGLHPSVIKALRSYPRLRNLVYISCNPESLVANAIELCTPIPDKPERCTNFNWWKMSSVGLARHRVKSMPKSEPFKPVRAMAIDLFPHTTHCELMMLLQR